MPGVIGDISKYIEMLQYLSLVPRRLNNII